jgi:hypothetical protein
MFLRQKSPYFLLSLFVSFFIASSGVSQTPKNNEPKAKEITKSIINPASTYKETCGQCHMAYPPDFLPSGSWIKILGSPKDHFGTPLDLDLQMKNTLDQYLTGNGAENSESRTASKIMASLEEDKTPLRLTEVPYIIKKHRKISPEVFQRTSIGSLAKCDACHRSAAEGLFSKKIVIPK